MRKIFNMVIVCLVVAGCSKAAPQPNMPELCIVWAPEAIYDPAHEAAFHYYSDLELFLQQ